MTRIGTLNSDTELQSVARTTDFAVFEHWYTALASREVRPATIMFHGDSLVEGKFASSKANTFVRKFTDGIQRMYRVGGDGWYSVGTYLTPWSFVGGSADTTFGLGRWARNLGTSATLTFTGDRLWLLFTGGTLTGTVAISIDGVSFGTFVTTSATLKTMKWDSGTIPESINGNVHTVVVTPSAGGSIIDGGFVFNTDYGRGVQVWEVGHTGFQASDFTNTALAHWTAIRADLLRPDLVFIQFGINEETTAVSKATFKANLLTLINQYRTLLDPNPSIVLLSIWARGDGSFTDANWQPYRDAMQELSASETVGLFDLYDMYGWLGKTGTVQVGDLVTNGTTTVSSLTAKFRNVDVGMGISGTNIPGGTTISSVSSPWPASPTVAVMSASATGSGTNPATFTNRKDYEGVSTDLIHPDDTGSQWIADEVQRKTAGLPKLANIPQGLADVKGDMPVATGPDNFVRLPVGIEGQVPHATPASATGVTYADPGVMSRILQYNANPGLATMTTTGFGSVAVITSATAATNSDQADGPYVRIGSSTTISTDGLITATTSPYAIVRPSWLPEFMAVVGTDAAITTSRIWAGLFSAAPQTGTDAAIHGVAFRYSTDVDGTAFWRCWTNDGTSTGTTTTTTVPIAVSTRYRLRIESLGTVGTNATSYRFYINDVLVAIHTTNLPGGSSNNLGPQTSIRALAGSAARFLLVGRISVSYK